MKTPLLSAIAVAAVATTLSSCGKPDNPLLAATDGQFLQWMAPRNGLAASCASALYEPELFIKQYNGIKFVESYKIHSVSEKQKAECESELLQRANQVGIQGNVTREHLRDDRVRQRYFANRKG